MKKYFLNIFFILFLVTNLQAQYPCVNSISTNPANPVNTQLPSKKNTFFDWQLSTWLEKPFLNQGNCSREDTMTSPFFRTDNAEELRDSKDMKWDDGWELILRRVGLNEQNINTPDIDPDITVILYNKYTGIIRILLKTCRGADYNAARISIRFASTSIMKTDLLEFGRGNISALDKKFSSLTYSAGYPYRNNNSKWFYADFPMMYDPCTCIYKSKLNIISDLISTSQINLEGSITGDIYTKDVGGKAEIQKPGSIGWKDIAGFVNGKLSTVNSSADKLISESQKFAENIGKMDTANKKSSLDKLGSFLKNNQFLKTGLNAVPWLKSAVSLVDIFIGGGKTTTASQEVKLMPLSVNLTARLKGTLTTTNGYHDVTFTNPGSKDAQLDPDIYPYYNEVMGVFNLVKTPVVFKVNNSVLCDDNRRAYGQIANYKFRFDADSFYYVLNGAADLSIQNMKAALMVKARPIAVDTTNMTNKQLNTSFQFFEGKDAVDSTYKFRTDYFDMKCLDRQIFTYQLAANALAAQKCAIVNEWNVNTDTLFLKLMINLKRNNATATTQNVLMVLTYPVKTVTDAVQVITPTFATCDSTILAPASAAFVNTFCNSTVYYNLDRQSIEIRDSIAVIKTLQEKGIAISPNPTKGNLKIQLKPQVANLLSFKIVDMSGRFVYNTNEGNIKLDNGFTKSLNLNLPNGTYILIAATTNKILKSKFIIVK